MIINDEDARGGRHGLTISSPDRFPHQLVLENPLRQKGDFFPDRPSGPETATTDTASRAPVPTLDVGTGALFTRVQLSAGGPATTRASRART
ncbi:hypothetical protein GCM10009867_01300 [Pedococcus aerophilus]|uniref:Uncharacterized protein n=1 Tax=Pedococcus aerophilus TaxID=436356 RepID=A0ABP6GVR5_9MICO